MKWVPWLFAWLVVFNIYKIITAFRTGKIGMYTAADAGHTYSRATEPWGFYRAIVLLALFTLMLALFALWGFFHPEQ